MSLNRCDTISYPRNWMDLLLMLTGGPYETNIDLCLISSDWPENNPGQQESWWLICADSGQTFSQTDQYYPRCSWKTGWACITKQTPNCLFTKAKATQHLCFPQCVCLWPQPWPLRATLSAEKSNPVLGLPLVLLWYSGSLLWVVAFLQWELPCLLWPSLDNHMMPKQLVNAVNLVKWLVWALGIM